MTVPSRTIDLAPTVAPIPGETKIWQYVSLTGRIYMIDCPGIVYDPENTDEVSQN